MSAWFNNGAVTRGRLGRLKEMEGSQVSLALRGGSRIDDCQLVSIGRNGVGNLWLFVGGVDVFVAIDEVLEVWEAVAGHTFAA